MPSEPGLGKSMGPSMVPSDEAPPPHCLIMNYRTTLVVKVGVEKHCSKWIICPNFFSRSLHTSVVQLRQNRVCVGNSLSVWLNSSRHRRNQAVAWEVGVAFAACHLLHRRLLLLFFSHSSAFFSPAPLIICGDALLRDDSCAVSAESIFQIRWIMNKALQQNSPCRAAAAAALRMHAGPASLPGHGGRHRCGANFLFPLSLVSLSLQLPFVLYFRKVSLENPTQNNTKVDFWTVAFVCF